MRRIYFFLMVVMLLPNCGGGYSEIGSREAGENGFHSFCTEGKTWNYMLFDAEKKELPEETYSYVVRGDTAIGDFNYKKLYYRKGDTERLAFMMREQGSKVFKLYPNKEERLFFDFGRDDVGLVHHWISQDGGEIVNWVIHTIDTVLVKKNYFRRYCCYQKYSGKELTAIEEGASAQKDYWVEGVGSARYGIEADGLELFARLPGITEYFVSCYENGDSIFTADDFTRPAYTTEIKGVKGCALQDGPYYDLQGRRISSKPLKGLYIKNGNKLIVK